MCQNKYELEYHKLIFEAINREKKRLFNYLLEFMNDNESSVTQNLIKLMKLTEINKVNVK